MIFSSSIKIFNLSGQIRGKILPLPPLSPHSISDPYRFPHSGFLLCHGNHHDLRKGNIPSHSSCRPAEMPPPHPARNGGRGRSSTGILNGAGLVLVSISTFILSNFSSCRDNLKKTPLVVVKSYNNNFQYFHDSVIYIAICLKSRGILNLISGISHCKL